MRKNFIELHSSLYEKTKFFVDKGLRLGQSMFNSLAEIDNELAVKITGTENDCFYDDNKICNFLKAVNETWSV